MTRWVRAALLLAVLGVAAVVALLAGGADEPARVTAPPVASLAPEARTADDLARAACVRLRLAAQGIAADSSATTVRTELAAARVLAAEAVRRDGGWAALSGGIAALDEAVRRDVGAEAVTGLRVALVECDRRQPGPDGS